MPHLVAMGMLTVDVLLVTDDSPSPLRMVRRQTTCLGGKGYIVAHTASAFGVDVDLVCELPMSPMFPDELCPRVGYDRSPRILDAPDRTWTVHVGSREETTFVRLGSRAEAAPAYVEIVRLMTGADAWYVAAAPTELLEAVVSIEPSQRPPLVLNASNALVSVAGGKDSALVAGLLRAADTVIVNDAEFKALAGKEPLVEGPVAGPLGEVPVIVITIGQGGAVVRANGSPSIAVATTTPVDEHDLATTLGAGDVFCGAWLASVLKGAQPIDACHAANRAANDKLRRFSSHL